MSNVTATTRDRLPSVFLPHGGGPWPFVDLGFGDPAPLNRLAAFLRGLAAVPATPPRAILMISAHWEEAVPTLMTGERPPLLFDYYGFPEAAYQLTWPAPGAPELAPRVEALLGEAGFTSARDAQRGFDHGTFVPLKLTYPEAELPVLQLSLKKGLDPEEHLAIGKALEPLRSEGVFILGSGMSFHNMRGFRNGAGAGASEEFDAWLGQTVSLPAAERNARLADWASAPSARVCHPREEHLLPLMVVAGAAGLDLGKTTFRDFMMGVRISGFQFG